MTTAPSGEDAPRSSRAVAHNFAILAFGEAVARALAFAATVYAARILEARHYGVIGVAAAIVLFLNRIVDGGFELGLGVREVANNPRLVTTGVASILTARAALGGLAIFAAAAAGGLFLPPVEAAVLFIQALTLLAVGFGSRWVHLAFGRAQRAAVATIAGQLVMAGSVLVLVRDGDDVMQLPVASVLGELTSAGLLLIGLRALGVQRLIGWDSRLITTLAPRSISMVASALLGIVIFSGGLVVLRALRGTEAAGHYTAAFSMVTFFLNVGTMYNLSLLPALTRLRTDTARQRELFSDALVYSAAWSVPLAAGGMVLAGPIVALVYGPSYGPATLTFGLLLWSVPLNVVRDVGLMTLLADGQEASVARLTLAGALTAVALSLVLVGPLGLAGAAMATLAAEGVRLGCAMVLAHRRGYVWPPAWRLGRIALATLLMLAAMAWTPSTGVFVAIAVGGAAYVLALLATRGLTLADGRFVVRI